MRIFGDTEWTWSGETGNTEHVIVATKGSAWEFLCRAESDWDPPRPKEYETVETNPKPTRDPWVWKHDLSKVTCADCLSVLARLDPGFRPSQVSLGGCFPPLVDTMGHAEAEAAAALLVRACQVQDDAWQDVDGEAIGRVIAEDLKNGTRPLCSMVTNPFVKPSMRDLVERGFAEWVSGRAATVRFTRQGLDALRKWVLS